MSWFACRVGLTGVGRILTFFPQFLVQAPSCPAVHHRVHYLIQEVLRAPQGLHTFRLSVPMLSQANGLLQVVFPVVFDYREHDLRCDSSVSAIMVPFVVSRLVFWLFLVCDGHVQALHRLFVWWRKEKRVREGTPRVA